MEELRNCGISGGNVRESRGRKQQKIENSTRGKNGEIERKTLLFFK